MILFYYIVQVFTLPNLDASTEQLIVALDGRVDLGDISEGDLFSALELGFKFAPDTKRAGYSKLTVWHTDGTADGKPINGSIGPLKKFQNTFKFNNHKV